MLQNGTSQRASAINEQVVDQIGRQALHTNLWLHHGLIRVRRYAAKDWVVIEHDEDGRGYIEARRKAKSTRGVVEAIQAIEKEWAEIGGAW